MFTYMFLYLCIEMYVIICYNNNRLQREFKKKKIMEGKEMSREEMTSLIERLQKQVEELTEDNRFLASQLKEYTYLLQDKYIQQGGMI